MKIVTLLALFLTLSGCGLIGSSKEEFVVQQDDLEFAVDTMADEQPLTEFKVEEEKVAESVMPDDYQGPPPIEDTAMTAPVEPSFDEFRKPAENVDDFIAESPAPAVQYETPSPSTMEAPAKINIEPIDQSPSASYGGVETYRVQKGDTLMMISFKIYGDYRKWKDIKELNRGTKLSEGVELKYHVPDQKFGWMPNGEPYLIKTGDTLQIISMDKYATTKKWKSIYDNNRPLIKNPNLIFAGFTIYYQPVRNLASEPK